MKKLVSIFAALIILALFSGGVSAKTDIQKLVAETQIIEQGDDYFKMIWWIPMEYWKASFDNNQSLTKAQKEEFYEILDDYIVLCVIDARMSSFSVFPKKKEEILKNIHVDMWGKRLKPLGDAKLRDDAKNLFAMMKPAIANMLGQFGSGMEFICFKNKKNANGKYLSPLEKGKFKVVLSGRDYVWRLPLGSLLPPKYDKSTGEEFPGNYNYNPYTGAVLKN